MKGEGVEVGVHMKIVVIQYLRHATRGRGGPACLRVCMSLEEGSMGFVYAYVSGCSTLCAEHIWLQRGLNYIRVTDMRRCLLSVIDV